MKRRVPSGRIGSYIRPGRPGRPEESAETEWPETIREPGGWPIDLISLHWGWLKGGRRRYSIHSTIYVTIRGTPEIPILERQILSLPIQVPGFPLGGHSLQWSSWVLLTQMAGLKDDKTEDRRTIRRPMARWFTPLPWILSRECIYSGSSKSCEKKRANTKTYHAERRAICPKSKQLVFHVAIAGTHHQKQMDVSPVQPPPFGTTTRTVSAWHWASI